METIPLTQGFLAEITDQYQLPFFCPRPVEKQKSYFREVNNNIYTVLFFISMIINYATLEC